MKSPSFNTIYIKEKMITKRFSLTLLVALICTFCFGQKVILLTKQNGVYTIPCSINGVKRSLVFDTGASTVTISMQLAELLYRQGKLSDSDIKGYGRSQTASGHIVDNSSSYRGAECTTTVRLISHTETRQSYFARKQTDNR